MTAWKTRGKKTAFFSSLDFSRYLRGLRPRVGEALLDIGCQTGELLSEAITLGLKSTGLEDNPEDAAFSLRLAPGAEVVVTSEQNLPFENNHFDLVTVLDLIAFFPSPWEGLREVHRVLKVGGRACILLTKPGSKHLAPRRLVVDDPSRQERIWSGKQWRQQIETAGLSIVSFAPDRSLKNGSPARNPFFFWQRWLQSLMNWGWKWMPQRWADRFICFCYKD